MRVAYYVPTVPSIASTARYNHALGLAEAANECLLLTHTRPPAAVNDVYDDVRVFTADVDIKAATIRKLTPRFEQARRAAAAADDFLNDGDIFVTTFHYGPALAGFYADTTWVVDVYDDPYQYIFNAPVSAHQVLARVLRSVLLRANRAVHTVHPNSPRLFGRERRFAINGAATSLVEPGEKPPRGPLRCVWAGKPRLDRGMEPILRALKHVDVSVAVDIFGSPSEMAALFAQRHGVSDCVTFHGQRPHEEILDAIQTAHVGLCVLPPREDWRHAYPIKLGEYLAGGTIPLCSPFYGIRQLARGTGVYAEPTAKMIRDRLEQLADCSRKSFKKHSAACRQQAEAISWSRERQWFAEQALEYYK